MKKLLIFLFIVPILVHGQIITERGNWVSLAGAAGDTISSIDDQDTLQYRAHIDGQAGAWTDVTETAAYITSAEKTAETVQRYSLAEESGWGWMQHLELRIKNASETVTAKMIFVAGCDGAISVHVVPDTAATYVKYTFKVGGN